MQRICKAKGPLEARRWATQISACMDAVPQGTWSAVRTASPDE